jgi:5-formyltetrahydrofolate cyclo-ligase
LAFGVSYVPDFEPEAHDVPLDAVLTDFGVAWPLGPSARDLR